MRQITPLGPIHQLRYLDRIASGRCAMLRQLQCDLGKHTLLPSPLKRDDPWDRSLKYTQVRPSTAYGILTLVCNIPHARLSLHIDMPRQSRVK